MIGDKLKEIRESTGMNKKQFAEFLGIKYTTYNGYETGSREPASDFLILVSSKCDVSIDYLLGLHNEKEITHSYQLKSYEYEYIEKYRFICQYSRSGQESIDFLLNREFEIAESLKCQRERIARLELLNSPKLYMSYYQRLASAGSGEYLFDDVPTDTIEVPVTKLSEQADFVVGVNGDSMEPTYYDGDRVYIKKMTEIPNGSIGLFTRGNECFIKELGVDRLVSHNKIYDDIPASNDIRLVGKVLGKVDEFEI